MEKHRVFISYHHDNDQWAKEYLLYLNVKNEIFIDCSVDIGDIDEGLSDERIREIIRDEYLKNSTVTILLVGIETKTRKHIDWELFSSMHDGKINKKSGILVIQLPSTSPSAVIAAHGDREKQYIYPYINSKGWKNIESKEAAKRKFPYLPDRIIDNLLMPKCRISVTNWTNILDVQKLKFLIDLTFVDKDNCIYNMTRPMKRKNSS